MSEGNVKRDATNEVVTDLDMRGNGPSEMPEAGSGRRQFLKRTVGAGITAGLGHFLLIGRNPKKVMAENDYCPAPYTPAAGDQCTEDNQDLCSPPSSTTADECMVSGDYDRCEESTHLGDECLPESKATGKEDTCGINGPELNDVCEGPDPDQCRRRPYDRAQGITVTPTTALPTSVTVGTEYASLIAQSKISHWKARFIIRVEIVGAENGLLWRQRPEPVSGQHRRSSTAGLPSLHFWFVSRE